MYRAIHNPNYEFQYILAMIQQYCIDFGDYQEVEESPSLTLSLFLPTCGTLLAFHQPLNKEGFKGILPLYLSVETREGVIR